jgi:hypothetical protein
MVISTPTCFQVHWETLFNQLTYTWHITMHPRANNTSLMIIVLSSFLLITMFFAPSALIDLLNVNLTLLLLVLSNSTSQSLWQSYALSTLCQGTMLQFEDHHQILWPSIPYIGSLFESSCAGFGSLFHRKFSWNAPMFKVVRHIYIAIFSFSPVYINSYCHLSDWSWTFLTLPPLE